VSDGASGSFDIVGTGKGTSDVPSAEIVGMGDDLEDVMERGG